MRWYVALRECRASEHIYVSRSTYQRVSKDVIRWPFRATGRIALVNREFNLVYTRRIREYLLERWAGRISSIFSCVRVNIWRFRMCPDACSQELFLSVRAVILM